MTTIEYSNYLITEEDDRIWELLDQRIFSDEAIDDRIFGSWDD